MNKENEVKLTSEVEVEVEVNKYISGMLTLGDNEARVHEVAEQFRSNLMKTLENPNV